MLYSKPLAFCRALWVLILVLGQIPWNASPVFAKDPVPVHWRRKESLFQKSDQAFILKDATSMAIWRITEQKFVDADRQWADAEVSPQAAWKRKDADFAVKDGQWRENDRSVIAADSGP